MLARDAGRLVERGNRRRDAAGAATGATGEWRGTAFSHARPTPGEAVDSGLLPQGARSSLRFFENGQQLQGAGPVFGNGRLAFGHLGIFFPGKLHQQLMQLLRLGSLIRGGIGRG